MGVERTKIDTLTKSARQALNKTSVNNPSRGTRVAILALYEGDLCRYCPHLNANGPNEDDISCTKGHVPVGKYLARQVGDPPVTCKDFPKEASTK